MSSTEPLEQRVFGALCRFTSEPTARGILRRAREQRSRGGADASGYMNAVLYGARLFVDEPKRTQLLEELHGVFETKALPDEVRVPVYDEHSARRARLMARKMAERMGARKLVSLRAATALSELTRNVLMYAHRGIVEIEVRRDPSMMCVVVCDEGPGIPHIEEILAGRYKSKTGLGRGITGVQKLANRFRIESGPTGTRVEFEMDL
jgi:serine/threonine-protein kinase RsbT